MLYNRRINKEHKALRKGYRTVRICEKYPHIVIRIHPKYWSVNYSDRYPFRRIRIESGYEGKITAF